ncbi:hypothetical protein E4U43_005629, partial [Claviceps pusilla]
MEMMETISNKHMKNDDQMHQDGRVRTAAYTLPRAGARQGASLSSVPDSSSRQLAHVTVPPRDALLDPRAVHPECVTGDVSLCLAHS